MLHEEALALRQRAEKLVTTVSGAKLTQATKVIALLDEAMAGGDLDRLQTAIDEATDTLIDLEF